MKLKCIVVDDEPIANGIIQRYCEKHGDLDLTGVFHDSASALNYLLTEEVDLLFLDVEMPGYTGFDLLDKLVYSPKIILTTGKTDYAFDAFQYNVFDYLKKPISFVRFKESIQKVTASIRQDVEEPAREDIFIKSDGKFIRLEFGEILYIESMGDYVKYYTLTHQYLTYDTLKSVEEKMDSKYFMKVHRSYIVNMSKIKDIQDNSIVINSKVIPISKAMKPNVMTRISAS